MLKNHFTYSKQFFIPFLVVNIYISVLSTMEMIVPYSIEHCYDLAKIVITMVNPYRLPLGLSSLRYKLPLWMKLN
ncbi:hypothetical protein BOW50_09945 [Solemya velum gill symbiont]|nr:hypothetical protein BOW50_09945 [Solemya velum gill symbiont]